MPHEFLMRSRLDAVFQNLETAVRLKADDEVPIVANSLVPFAYDGLIRSILELGYKPGVDFWAFPYDWRQSNKVSGQLLARFIEQILPDSNDGVDIVSHSMGGIITRAAYAHGAPVSRAVYIACPHLGSPLAYFILHPQIDSRRFIGAAYHNYSDVPAQPGEMNPGTIPRKDLYQRRKELFVKFPSFYELLPDETYLIRKPILLADRNQTFGSEDTYLRNDWAFKVEDMRTKVREAMAFKKELAGGPLVKSILNICGIGQPTCDAIDYSTYFHVSTSERKSVYLMQQGFSPPYDSGQRGDGYVPIISSMSPDSGDPYRESRLVRIPETHGSLPNSKVTTVAIGRFLAS